MPWSRVQPEMVLRTCRGGAEGAGTRTSEEVALKQPHHYDHYMHSSSPPGLFPIKLKLLKLDSSPLLLPLISSSSSLYTDHLLYLGHPTSSTKSTTTVAIVTRCRGASCHGVSPGPSHPSRTTGCAHCCVTELLRLKWGGD